MPSLVIKTPVEYAYNDAAVNIEAVWDDRGLWIAPDAKVLCYLNGKQYGDAVFRKGTPSGSAIWQVKMPASPAPTATIRVEYWNTGVMDSGLRASAEQVINLSPRTGNVNTDPVSDSGWSTSDNTTGVTKADTSTYIIIGGIVVAVGLAALLGRR